MKFESDGLRKTAIVVSSLPTQAADRLLDCFTPEQAQRVRQAMVDLDEVDPRDEQRVLEEFFRTGSKGSRPNDRPRSKVVADTYVPSSHAHADGGKSALPFRFLRDAEADKLARVLAGERPQTIALVLSHLSPEQAGPVLTRLGASMQVDVIHRLIDLEETDPAILEEVEQALETRLSQQVRMQRRRVAGLQAVAGILEASPRAEGAQILQTLAARDPSLAERFAPPPVEFDDLVRADARTWGVLIEAADPEVVLLALFGAPPSLVSRILGRMPSAEAEAFRHKLDHPGPVRLSDVEQARQELADLARQLAGEGRIRLRGEMRSMMGVAA
jgi:flagellar motor switch protein FliG